MQRDWGETAERQHGVVSRRQLHASGVSGTTVSRMLQRGALTRCDQGVFLVRGAPLTQTANLWMRVLSTGGVLGFATAAHLWGMDDVPPLVHVIVGDARRIRRDPGLRRHHVFVPRSAVTKLNGIPVTSRSWTLLDHLGRLSPSAAVRLADRALQQGWLRRQDLSRRVRDYPGRQGNRQLRRLFDATGDGAAAESERRLHGLLRQHRIHGWKPNFAVRCRGVRVAVVDVAFPGARLAIEVDGFAFHSDVDRFQRDRQRQNALVELGWTVLRFTWADLTERPEQVVAAIRAQLARS